MSTAWMEQGLCRQSDPDAWFPAKGDNARPVKEICAKCPVRLECLQFAIENHEVGGIWGGLSYKERCKFARWAA